MIQSEILHNSWPLTNQIDPFYEDQDSSEISFSDFTSLFPDYDLLTNLPMDDLSFDDVSEWFNDSESEGNENMKITLDTRISSPALSSVSTEPSTKIPSINSAIIFQGNSKEMDTQMSLLHLLTAYGEAMQNGHKELAQVIIRSIKGKINPLGK